MPEADGTMDTMMSQSSADERSTVTSGWTAMRPSREGRMISLNTSSQAPNLTDVTSRSEKTSSAWEVAERMFRAYLRKTSPAGVRRVSPRILSKSFLPVIFSSSATFWLMAGWLTPRASAAFVKLLAAATVTNTFNLKSSNIISSFVQK